MEHVQYQTQKLIHEIKESRIYSEYTHIRAKLEQNEEVYEKLKAFLKQSFWIQIKPEKGQNMQELEYLNEEYKEILQNTDVRDYLTAEQQVATMVNQMMDQIYESLDIDVSFLDN